MDREEFALSLGLLLIEKYNISCKSNLSYDGFNIWLLDNEDKEIVLTVNQIEED